MIRRPTKIELKQDDDYGEYEEFKKKQLEQARLHKMAGESGLRSSNKNYRKGLPQQDLLNSGGGRGDQRTDPNFLYFQNMLRNSEGGLPNPAQGQSTTEHMIDQQSNNFIFSVLLNSISQSDQASFERPSFNTGAMDFERSPDNRNSTS